MASERPLLNRWRISTCKRLKSWQNAGDLTGAAGAVERSLKIKPEAPEALFVLASLHYRIGQKDDAAGILDYALTIDPSHPRCTEMLKSIRNGNGA